MELTRVEQELLLHNFQQNAQTMYDNLLQVVGLIAEGRSKVSSTNTQFDVNDDLRVHICAWIQDTQEGIDRILHIRRGMSRKTSQCHTTGRYISSTVSVPGTVSKRSRSSRIKVCS